MFWLHSLTHALLGSPLFFGKDFLSSADGTLSEQVQTAGIETLQAMLGQAWKHGVVCSQQVQHRVCDFQDLEHYWYIRFDRSSQRAAIATEVFRKARNGAAFLERVDALMRGGDAPTPRPLVSLVSQTDEGQLGYASATAIASMRGALGDSDSPAVWDSGGASFQICRRASDTPPDTPLQCFMGALGSSVCLSILLRDVQQKPLDACPNPVSASEAERLMVALLPHLPVAPAWLVNAPVLALGGCVACNTCLKTCLTHFSSHGLFLASPQMQFNICALLRGAVAASRCSRRRVYARGRGECARYVCRVSRE